MTSDNFITKVQRALALIADIGSSIASVEKKLEEFFKSRLASVTPRITARSGFYKTASRPEQCRRHYRCRDCLCELACSDGLAGRAYDKCAE